jgi:hypothetical protein
MMAQDIFTVPATGAGIDHQFSFSGCDATWDRALLRPETICEMMRYKDYLNRIGKPLTRNKGRKEDGESAQKWMRWKMRPLGKLTRNQDDHDNLAVA